MKVNGLMFIKEKKRKKERNRTLLAPQKPYGVLPFITSSLLPNVASC